MFGLAGGSRQIWGRLVAIALIYALVLQGMAVASATAQFASKTAADIGWSGVELCQHDGSSHTLPGSLPDDPANSRHCIYCLAGAPFVVGPTFYTPNVQTVFVDIATWPFSEWQLPKTTVVASARSRGPPPAA